MPGITNAKICCYICCSCLLLFGSACQRDQAGVIGELVGSQSEYGGKLTLSVENTQAELNPFKNRSRSARSIYYLIYDNLIDIDHNMQFVPRLAKSWEISENATRLIFHLRDDVHWHNDKLFTASDVLYSYERYRELPDPECPGKKLFHRVTGIETLNPYTIVVHYDSPSILSLGDWIIEIVPRPEILQDKQSGGGTFVPVGSGPYLYNQALSSEKQISLGVFESYWNGRSHIDRIDVRILKPGQDSKQLYASGDLDHIQFSPEEISSEAFMKAQSEMQVVPFSSIEYYYIGWHCSQEHPFFSHRRIRKAMSLTLNREKIKSDIFSDCSNLCDVPLPGWAINKGLRSLPYSPTIAVDLLREIGCKDRNSDGIRELHDHNFEFTLIFPQNDYFAHGIARHFQDSLRKIGVIMTPLSMPESEFARRLDAREYDAFLTRGSLSLRGCNLLMFVGSDDPEKENVLGFHDPELNAHLNELLFNGAAEKIDTLFDQIADRILQEQPCTFIIYKPSVHGLHKRIRIMTPAQNGLWEWYPSILDWYIPKHLQQNQSAFLFS
ncbi:hypothetical protein JXQ70_07125 [bacterium]|nr:hypothetical protein [bacterium]